MSFPLICTMMLVPIRQRLIIVATTLIYPGVLVITIIVNATGISLEPVYKGAQICTEASWIAIRDFATTNKLTDTVTQQLLDLIQLHCPVENSCPKTLYKLKNHHQHSALSQNQCYCSVCKSEIPKGTKKCPKQGCDGHRCYFSVLPFERRLKQIYSGTNCMLCSNYCLYTCMWCIAKHCFLSIN